MLVETSGRELAGYERECHQPNRHDVRCSERSPRHLTASGPPTIRPRSMTGHRSVDSKKMSEPSQKSDSNTMLTSQSRISCAASRWRTSSSKPTPAIRGRPATEWNCFGEVRTITPLIGNSTSERTNGTRQLVYKRNPNSERTDYGQYAVFMTNAPPRAVREYNYRWEIESGYESIKRFMAATISKDFVLRFFYFVFACLLYSIWRAVDFLVQIALTDKYDRSPMVTAQNTLTLLQKRTGVGWNSSIGPEVAEPSDSSVY